MERMFDGSAALGAVAKRRRTLARARYHESTVEERKIRAVVAAAHHRECTLRRTLGWWQWAQSNAWLRREAERLGVAVR